MCLCLWAWEVCGARGQHADFLGWQMLKDGSDALSASGWGCVRKQILRLFQSHPQTDISVTVSVTGPKTAPQLAGCHRSARRRVDRTAQMPRKEPVLVAWQPFHRQPVRALGRARPQTDTPAHAGSQEGLWVPEIPGKPEKRYWKPQ